MIDRYTRDLKLDRRLTRRRGWISESERESALSSLPDVADKAETVKIEDEAKSTQPETQPDPVEPAAPAPPDFGGSDFH